MPKDISGGGFVDHNTNACIKAILRNLKLKVNQISTLAEMTIFRQQLNSGHGTVIVS